MHYVLCTNQTLKCNKWEYPCAFNEIPTFISSTLYNHYLFVGMGVEWGAGATPLSAEFWLKYFSRIAGNFALRFSLYSLKWKTGKMDIYQPQQNLGEGHTCCVQNYTVFTFPHPVIYYPFKDGASIKHWIINNLRKNICLRKSEVLVERISACYVIENLAEHDIHCLPCFFTNDVINILP